MFALRTLCAHALAAKKNRNRQKGRVVSGPYNYELWFLVKRTNLYHFVTLPNDKTVAQLKENIRQPSRNLCDDADATTLDLLKVNMLFPHNEFDGLQAPDDAEEMCSRHRMEQLWPDQPTGNHLHAYVRIPGPGESILLFYVLLHWLINGLPTALQLANTCVFFLASGAYLCSGDDRSVDIPRGTLALTDTDVKAASPYQDGWKKWYEQYEADLYVLNYFSADEIKVLGIIRGLQVDDILRIYNTWGPDTPNYVWFPRQPVAELGHKLQFLSQGELYEFSRRGRWVLVKEVASEHVSDLIPSATIKAETAEQTTFFSSLRTHPWFKSATSRILKAFVLTRLSAHPVSTPIPCTAAASVLALKIPVSPKHRVIPFNGLTILEDIKKYAPPFPFLPVSQTFPTVGAIVFGNKLLITV
ncbi:hypothetical protein EDB87DRAFT_1575068 [Lactarius vividus]|nr:hypothetical protein EDB87DRAFT_1575068 [Lactarius vividus]